MSFDAKEFFQNRLTGRITYYRPTLLLYFIDGDKRETTPTHWHRGRETDWSTYYVVNNILLNRYPLTAIKEVEILSVEKAEVAVYGDSSLAPTYATTEEVEKKIFKKGRFGR